MSAAAHCAGAELELRYNISRKWELLQSLAYAPHSIVENEKHSDPVQTPEWISFTELQFNAADLTVVLQGRYQSKSFIDFGNKHELSSSAIFNLLAKYQIKKIGFSLRLMNLTNEKTYTSGQLNVYGQPIYQVQAPFHLLGGVHVKF